MVGECISHDTYTSSPQFLVDSLFYLTFIEIPVHLYGAYCILFRSHPQMKSLKWASLNLQFWLFVYDLFVSFVSVPYIYFPMIAGYSLGVFEFPILTSYLFITLSAATGASLVWIFENRFYALVGKSTRWKKFRKPVLVMSILYVPLLFAPPFLYIPDQQQARVIVYERLPCLPQNNPFNRTLFILAVDGTVALPSISIGIFIYGTEIFAFFCLTFYNLFIKKKFITSDRTHKMQKKLALALTAQAIVIISSVILPILFFLFTIGFWYHNQTLNNFMTIGLCLHGILSTIVMILAHQSYRQHFAHLFCTLLKIKVQRKVHSDATINVIPS